jgi:hypothetical protein
MLLDDRSQLTIAEAHNILTALSDMGSKPEYSEERSMKLREALLFLKAHTDYQIFGVCADSFERGMAALQEYTQAFGYSFDPVSRSEEGAIYIKFNPNRSLFHVAPYSGEYEGVLISYQSDDGDGNSERHNGTYGHFPLDLFR